VCHCVCDLSDYDHFQLLSLYVFGELIHGFVTTRFGLCNSVFIGISDISIRKCQFLHNLVEWHKHIVSVFTISRKTDNLTHITLILKKNWLGKVFYLIMTGILPGSRRDWWTPKKNMFYPYWWSWILFNLVKSMYKFCTVFCIYYVWGDVFQKRAKLKQQTCSESHIPCHQHTHN